MHELLKILIASFITGMLLFALVFIFFGSDDSLLSSDTPTDSADCEVRNLLMLENLFEEIDKQFEFFNADAWL